MSSKLLTLAACLLCVSFARATAVPMTSDAEFGRSLEPIMSAASDGHYKLVEKRAKQTLDVLKTLRDYADQVKNGSEKLRKEMLDHHYQDWVNTRLTPEIFEAKSVPPQPTRAKLRGEFIRRAQEKRRDFTVDWVHLKLNDQAQRTVLCKDPFRSGDERVEKLIAGM